MRNTALALIFLSLTACASRRAVRQEQKEVQRLGESAGVYWHAVRWSHYGHAAGYYLDQEYRMNWMNKMVTSPDYRYSSAEVMRVEVTPEFDEAVEGVEREGRVFIQVQGYRLPDQVMEQKVVTQSWNRYEGGWFVDTEDEEAAAEESEAAAGE